MKRYGGFIAGPIKGRRKSIRLSVIEILIERDHDLRLVSTVGIGKRKQI